MDMDNVSYEEAHETFLAIERKNHEGLYLVSLPYQIRIFSACAVGAASIPLVFHLPTIEWFNECMSKFSNSMNCQLYPIVVKSLTKFT
jgi:hypothetical protein